jgi:hypothetical protein
LTFWTTLPSGNPGSIPFKKFEKETYLDNIAQYHDGVLVVTRHKHTHRPSHAVEKAKTEKLNDFLIVTLASIFPRKVPDYVHRLSGNFNVLKQIVRPLYSFFALRAQKFFLPVQAVEILRKRHQPRPAPWYPALQ